MVRAFVSVPGPVFPAPELGLGVLCREAQADGVPCDQLAVPCAECARGRRALAAEHRRVLNGRQPDERPHDA